MPSYKDSLRDARMDAITTALGTTPYLEIFTGSQPGKTSNVFNADTGTKLSSNAMSNPAGGATVNGVLTFGAIGSATASASGTPGYYRKKTAAGGAASTVIEEGPAGVGSGELNFNSTIASGGTVSITSDTLTEGNP
jgi:hypothetical protein